MPVGSDPGGSSGPPPLPALPHTWRPTGPRIMGIVLLVALAVVCAVAWIGFDDETKARFTAFEKGTLAFFGLLIVVLVHALTRSRIDAREDRLVIVNGYRRRDLDWAQVVAVNFPRGAPWPNLDLTDGTNIPAMGIQASDGGSARTSARQLSRLVASHAA